MIVDSQPSLLSSRPFEAGGGTQKTYPGVATPRREEQRAMIREGVDDLDSSRSRTLNDDVVARGLLRMSAVAGISIHLRSPTVGEWNPRRHGMLLLLLTLATQATAAKHSVHPVEQVGEHCRMAVNSLHFGSLSSVWYYTKTAPFWAHVINDRSHLNCTRRRLGFTRTLGELRRRVPSATRSRMNGSSVTAIFIDGIRVGALGGQVVPGRGAGGSMMSRHQRGSLGAGPASRVGPICRR